MKIRIALIILIFSVTVFAQAISDRYYDAMNAFNNGRYVESARLFDEFFTNYEMRDELYASAKYFYSEALIKINKNDQAAVGYEYIVNNFKWTNYRDKSLYKLGLIYYQDKLYENSRDRFRTLLEEHPNSEHAGSALYWIGESFAEENRLEDAIQFLQEAVDKGRDNRYIDYSLFTLASIYERIGDYESAVRYYDELLSFHRSSPLAVSAQIRIGICYFNLKDYHSSILELNNPMLSELPLNLYSESLYLLANSYYRVQDYRNAEKTYLEIIQNFPASEVIRDVQYGLAWTYFQQGKYQDAYKLFHFLSTGRDALAEKSFYWKAESKRYAGQEVEAFNLYKEFVEKFPRSPLVQGVQYQMGVLYFNSRQLDLSERYLLASTSSTDPLVRARAFTMLGDLELNKRQFISARNKFETAVNIPVADDDVRNRAMLGLGVALYYMNQYKDAIEALTDIDIRDKNFERDRVNFYLAENYFASGNFKEAIVRFSNVDPKNKEFGNLALYGKAYSYFNSGDYENAAYQFLEFTKLFPNDPKIIDVRLRLADSYYGSRNFTAASNIYKQLFASGRTAINDPYAHYQYAQALYKAGNINEARNEFRTISEKYPRSEYADASLFTVGWISFQQSSFTDAIMNYKTVLSTYPNSGLAPIVYYSIGDSYFNLARYDSAITYYQRVMLNYPNSNYVFDAVNGLQYSYVAMGQPERAIATIDEFISRNPALSFSDQVFFKKGEIYYSIRNYEKAKMSYKEFAANYPRSKFVPDAYYWIGKSAQNQGQFEEAVFNFSRVFESYTNSEVASAAVIELGNIYNAQKNFTAAINIYNSALDKLPKSVKIPEILFMKGMTLLAMNDIPNAYEVFDEIIMYHRTTIFADLSKFEVGMIELSSGRFDNAVQLFKDLAESRSDDLGAKSQYYLGVTYFDQRRFTDAITALVRVRTIFSTYDQWLAMSFLKLGECYVELKDIEQAKEMYRIVLTKHGGDEFGKEAQNRLRVLR